MKVEEIISISPQQRKMVKYSPSEDSPEKEIGITTEDGTVLPLFSVKDKNEVSCNPHDIFLTLESDVEGGKTIMRYYHNPVKEFDTSGYKFFSKSEMYIHIPYEQSILVFDLDGVLKQKIEGVDGKVIFAYRDTSRETIVYILEKENEIQLIECLSDKCAIYPILQTTKEKISKVFLQGNHLFIITSKKRLIEFFLSEKENQLEGIFQRLSKTIEKVEYSSI